MSSLTFHCSLLNWLSKLDPKLSLKIVSNGKIKVRKLRGGNNDVLVNNENSSSVENSKQEFKVFLIKTIEQIRSTPSLLSVMKQYPKLAVLQHEALKHPTLLCDIETKALFADLFDCYSSRATEEHKTKLLVQFWCFTSFKKLVLSTVRDINHSYKESDILSEYDTESLDDDDILGDLVGQCLQNQSLCKLTSQLNFLKIFVLFSNVFDRTATLRFDTFLKALELKISQCSSDIQLSLLRVSRNTRPTFPSRTVSLFEYQRFLGLLPKNVSMVCECLKNVSNFVEDIIKSRATDVVSTFITLIIENVDRASNTEFSIFSLYTICWAIEKCLFTTSTSRSNQLEASILLNIRSDCLQTFLWLLSLNPYKLPKQTAIEVIQFFLNELEALEEDGVDSCKGVFSFNWCFWLIENSLLTQYEQLVDLVFSGSDSGRMQEQLKLHVCAIETIIKDGNSRRDHSTHGGSTYSEIVEFHRQRRLFLLDCGYITT